MKKITLKALFVAIALMSISSIQAQNKRATAVNNAGTGLSYNQLTLDNQRMYDQTGHVKCTSIEMHERRMQREGSNATQYNDAFEQWITPLVEQKKLEIAQQKANGTFKMAVTTIPIIFHIITDGAGPENLSAAQIQAQIDQLNLDFSNMAGSTNPVAADAMVQFIPALVDPNGNTLPEPGIDRITTFGDGPFPTSDFDVGDGGLEIKSTVWDRNLYANIWTADISGGILGYAQFPSNSTLPGFNVNGGTAQNDGVVIGYGTAGSVANPGSAAPYNLGRTLTHEIGHWIGLRHIWGDGGCGADDFCNDTPTAGGANYGTAQNNSCGSADQVENYMDYTDDSVMNIFTADQVARIATVISVADGFVDLVNSPTGGAPTPTVAFTDPSPTANSSEGSACAFTDITRTVTLGTAASANTTVSFAVNAGGTTATNLVDYELMTSSVSYTVGDTGTRDMVIRVYHDAFVEGDETVQIDLTVNANGGDATAGTNTTLNFTISDDDAAVPASPATTLFSDDFESYTPFDIGNIGGWTMNDGDGANHYGDATVDFTNENYVGTFIVFNPALTTAPADANWNPHGGNQGYYCFAATDTNNSSGGFLNDDHIITPQINLTGTGSELRFWARTLVDTWGLERFNVKVSTTNTNIPSFTTIQPNSGSATPYHEAPVAWTEYVYDLSAYDGQNIYIAINDVSADSYVFMLDDISVTTNLGIQTAVNDNITNDQLNLSGSGIAYTADSATGNLMLDITNNNTFDYGCTTTAVFRAGNGAQAYNGSATPNLAMDKVFIINPENDTTSEDATIKFYFTDAEIQGWLTANPGETINDIVAYREDASEMVNLTATSFGTDHILTGNFTGVNGSFYFGTSATFASILVAPKVYLQGAALNPNTGEETLMRDDLRVAGYIPTTSPYTDGLTCNASVFNVTGANAIVDWVEVELRDGTTNTTVLYSQSGLLQRDGDVVGVDGVTALTFGAISGNYYVAINHHNHLGIMSANSIALSTNSTTVDFSDSTNQITYGTNAQTTYGMQDGFVGMWAGNVGGDASVRYLGSGNDANSIKDVVLADLANTTSSNLHSFTGYDAADINLDGFIRYQGSGNDTNILKDIILSHPNNQSTPSNLFLITEQLP